MSTQGFEYSRSGNPNGQALETMLAALESGGTHAIAFSSGSAGTATMVQAVGPNTHILSVNDVYGGTFRYLKRVASEMQALEVSFLDFDDDAILAAFQPNITVCFVCSFPELPITNGGPCRARSVAYLDRDSHEPDASARGYTPDRFARAIASIAAPCGRRQHVLVAVLPVPSSSWSRRRSA